MPQSSKVVYCAMMVMLGILTAIPLLCDAQHNVTVKVGNEVKDAIGLVKHLENGDVACYITLENGQGREFMELARFDICFQKPSILGKRVTLKYKLEPVMADECQGNPDCKKSKKIAMVTEARIWDAKLVPMATPGVATNAATSPATNGVAPFAQGQASLCTPMEEVVFACRTGAKLVSVCASRDASPRRGYVQYRFGKSDSREPLDMLLPADRPLAAQAARGASVAFAGGGGAWLRFQKPPFAYVVYSGIGKWGPKGETTEKQGVVVERNGKSIASLKCSGKPTSVLGPVWFDQVGVSGGGEDFEFPD
ncbi:MAG: hypothetical protein ABI790_09800 [Betaproteobacteria bacterium]